MHTPSNVRLLTAALVAAGIVLAGCGSDNSSDSSVDSSRDQYGQRLGRRRRSPVTSGTEATVKFDGAVTDSTQTTKVLTEGDGDTVEQGDSLILHTVIADGTTQKTVASSYDDHQPQVVSLSSQVQKLFLDALTGKTIGSRVAVYAPAEDIFGRVRQPAARHQPEGPDHDRLRPDREAPGQAGRQAARGAVVGPEDRRRPRA